MRLTKRQLKRIIREEYSRLKRRGLIKESVIGASEKQAIQAYIERVYMDSDFGGAGEVEVISCDNGILQLPLPGYEDVVATDMQDLRTQIEGITGNLKGECKAVLAEYFDGFDTLICVRNGQLMSCPKGCWELLPMAIVEMEDNPYPDGSIRPACRFKMDASMCEPLGTLKDAMAGGMMESHRRRRTSRRNRRY